MFRDLPYESEDAAAVDGASPFRVFWQIMFSLARPAVLVVMLFSLVWTWNDGIGRFEENTFMAAVTLTVLPMLTIYTFTQHYFTQSIDRIGLVE